MQAQSENPCHRGEVAAAPESPTPKTRRPPRRRIDEFIEVLRLSCLADKATGEALTFFHLLLTHPRPPREIEPLKRSLTAAITRNLPPVDRADRFRHAASLVVAAMGSTPSSRVMELLLYEHALQWHDSPAQCTHLIKLILAAANMRPLRRDDTVFVLEDKDDNGAAAIDSALARQAVQGHSTSVCTRALLEIARAEPFARWDADDLEAAILVLRFNYGAFLVDLAGQRMKGHALRDDFRRHGQPLWNRLRTTLKQRPPGRDPLKSDSWHEMAQARMLLAIDKSLNDKPASHTSAPTVSEQTDIGPTLVVCRRPIAASSDRQDKDEIERHLILQSPLPVALMPSRSQLQASQARLVAEFPWGADVLEQIYAELIGRASLGVAVLGMPPTLLVGAPGSGKSRLARRIAQELGVPRLDLPLGGTSDSKVLGGTCRGWSTGRPSDLATLMAHRCCASAIVMLDELDKAGNSAHEGAGIHSYLLALLEPETASRHTDMFLKTECDFSRVMWIATANRLSSIPAPLVSRMRVLMLRQPRAEDHTVVADNVLAEIAERWGVDRGVLPTLYELRPPLEGLGSAREVRVATEVAVTAWARQVQRH